MKSRPPTPTRNLDSYPHQAVKRHLKSPPPPHWGGWTSTPIQQKWGITTPPCWVGVRGGLLPSGNQATTPMVSVEAMWGALMRHSHTSQPGWYQWRPTGEPELPSISSSNKKTPPPPPVNQGWVGNLDFFHPSLKVVIGSVFPPPTRRMPEEAC